MPIDPDVQEYLNLTNEITEKTYNSQLTRAQNYIKEHFAARGLSSSGPIQQALQEYGEKFADSMNTAKLRNAAMAWQMQTQKNTVREMQKMQDSQNAYDSSTADALTIQQAMNPSGEPDWVTRAKKREEGFFGQAKTTTMGQPMPSQPYDNMTQAGFNQWINSPQGPAGSAASLNPYANKQKEVAPASSLSTYFKGTPSTSSLSQI